MDNGNKSWESSGHPAVQQMLQTYLVGGNCNISVEVVVTIIELKSTFWTNEQIIGGSVFDFVFRFFKATVLILEFGNTFGTKINQREVGS